MTAVPDYRDAAPGEADHLTAGRRTRGSGSPDRRIAVTV